jgi:hypothetical protein
MQLLKAYKPWVLQRLMVYIRNAKNYLSLEYFYSGFDIYWGPIDIRIYVRGFIIGIII